MHIAVGNISSTLRTVLFTLILGAATTANASYIHTSSLAYRNDKINNICFQKIVKTSDTNQGSQKDWRIDAMSQCKLTRQEIGRAFSKKSPN